MTWLNWVIARKGSKWTLSGKWLNKTCREWVKLNLFRERVKLDSCKERVKQDPCKERVKLDPCKERAKLDSCNILNAMRLLTTVYHCFLQPQWSDHPTQPLHTETLAHACWQSLSIRQSAHTQTSSRITNQQQQQQQKLKRRKWKLSVNMPIPGQYRHTNTGKRLGWWQGKTETGSTELFLFWTKHWQIF